MNTFLRPVFLVSSVLLLGSFSLYAQEEQSLDDVFKVNYETPLTLDLKSQEEEDAIVPVKKKKKKVKKKVFFGIKTRKGYTRSGFGNKVVWEQFYTLKEYEGPPPYARDFYWYNYKKKKIVNSLKVDEKNAAVLHGPYKKILGDDQVIEEGWYYKGMKHRRWVRLNRHDILQDKSYWWKGWPQESRLAYYDFQKTKLKEVIPVRYEERNGEYWAFHKNGSIAVRGEYKFGHKVGLWREYYKDRRIKREVLYPEDPFDFDFVPTITREWDDKGTQIYDRDKFLKGMKN